MMLNKKALISNATREILACSQCCFFVCLFLLKDNLGHNKQQKWRQVRVLSCSRTQQMSYLIGPKVRQRTQGLLMRFVQNAFRLKVSRRLLGNSKTDDNCETNHDRWEFN